MIHRVTLWVETEDDVGSVPLLADLDERLAGYPHACRWEAWEPMVLGLRPDVDGD